MKKQIVPCLLPATLSQVYKAMAFSGRQAAAKPGTFLSAKALQVGFRLIIDSKTMADEERTIQGKSLKVWERLPTLICRGWFWRLI